jgi:hypothetical protein
MALLDRLVNGFLMGFELNPVVLKLSLLDRFVNRL